MPNNDDQLQQQYQEILNKYASSLEPVPEPVLEPQTPKVENLMPKPEPEFVPPVAENILTKPEPKLVPPIVEKPITPPIYFPPEPMVSTDKPSNFFKYLFYFSLLIFVGVLAAVIYSFSNSQQPIEPTVVLPTPTTISAQMCELKDKKYNVGENFSSEDGCNTCSCTSNLTIACTEKACVTPTAVSTPKPIVGKLYKDIKYGYQFTCPTGAKYVLEATSINGNKIPFKQESCTLEGSSVTISVYDNTIVHSFANLQTQVSPDKKYIFTLEGDNSDIISTFKFL